jgi:photosystem II stability/assembly factor-like uncharacterized protein
MSVKHWRIVLSVAASAALAGAASPAEEPVTITSDTFGGIQARAIGPATMSGRIAAIDAVPTRPLTIYVGAASGGVWKSIDAGTSFKPVFDEHTQSIGAITVDPTDPKTVWVGTGETWVRNSVSVGDGVYKSTDGGDTWQHLGLTDSERIARIVVDPKQHDTVYVCATGHLWNANAERGVFKTTDGGKSWKKVLFVDEGTGCSDLAIDAQETHVLYAGMWQFRRSPDFFTSGGKGSGLYKSTDGGETWNELKNGLPSGEKGRIAVAVAPSRPSRLYALVEAKETGLYRSDDMGGTWKKVNGSMSVTMRPFYFSLVVVDPTDFDTVYKPGLSLAISTDGGEAFTSPFVGGEGGDVHSDHHALWINPNDPNEMVLGTDGGVYISRDKAHHFAFVRSLPVSQFYHVSTDMARPYNVYGGLQDNGSWMGPSRSPGGIQNRDWDNIGYGDGFWSFPDPSDPDIAYSEYQGGRLLRVRKSLSEVKDIRPYQAEGEEELRFNWNTPIHLSVNDPGTIYYGAQYLFRSRDRGESWQRVSPDLTTDDPHRQRQKQSGGLTIDNSTAENNATIYCISEAPGEHDTIWVGTDDGRLQVTRDAGETWTDVFGNLPGVPKGTWVSSVSVGRHAEGTAYVTLDGHRTGDMKTYVFGTTDYGATWQSLATEAIQGYAWVIREDTVNPDLLFLGTERGLWISLDGGGQWARFKNNLPEVAVHDLAIQTRENDLVIATHGRGVYIIDDLTPIRALTAATLEADAALLPARPAEMTITATLQDFPGDDEFVGRNPREAAIITYWLKKRHIFGDLKVEVYDHDGALITTIPGGKRVGINRVEWPMRLKAPKVPPASSLVPAFVGPRVAEGTYKIKLIKGKQSYDGEVTLVADPRSPHTAEDRALQQKTAMALYHDLEDMTYLVDSVIAVRDEARARAGTLGTKDRLARDLRAWADELEAFRGTVVSTSEAGMLSGDEKLREKLGDLYGSVSGYDGRPTDSQVERTTMLEGELATAKKRFDGFTGARLAELDRKLGAKKLEPIEVPTREQWKKKQEAAGAGVTASARDIASAVQALGFMSLSY